jgi:hypothetical protein
VTDLHDLLHDAVDAIEPSDRLADLRARTADPVHAAARPWFWAAGATVLATAAAVVIVAVVSSGPGDPDPAHHRHSMATDPTPTPAGSLVATYYFADTSRGPRLFREFDQIEADKPLEAAQESLMSDAADPDYRTAWPAGSIADTGFDGIGDDGEISVVLDRSSMLHRPEGLSHEEAELAVQQVVYTFQAALQTQAPVSFYYGMGEPADQVYGISTPGPVDADPSALNPVSISDPAEGNEYSGSFTARGRVRSSERTLRWNVVLGAHTIAASGTATIDAGEGSFSPWSAEIDLSGVAPGTYGFVVSTSDGAYDYTFADTRTIIVR